MAKFTIGIPTYNRAGFLRRAIESALDQTYPDVEVLVSDNASTDETSEVVRSFGDRVRYHRQSENLGSWPNFIHLTAMASGEYFTWLQDDDLIHPRFAERAVRNLTQSRDVVLYLAYMVNGPSYTTFSRPDIYGPPVALDWFHEGPRVLPGLAVLPPLFFVSFGMPPAMAAPTDVIRRAVRHCLPESDCVLYNERIVVAHAALEGKVAVDPWLAAVFLLHEGELCQRLLYGQPGEYRRQWANMANHLCEVLASSDGDWQFLARECFRDVAVMDRLRWLDDESPPEEIWRDVHPIAGIVRDIMIQSLPPVQRQKYTRHATVEVADDMGATTGAAQGIKLAARSLTPPLLWEFMRVVKRRVGGVPVPED
jgi:glycosyltransferase involved in cell wall biosynthesis